jgi:apolipoprotein N-acyltransferase
MSMASLAHTQYRWVELIQVSDLAGEYGVSFVVMCVAAALARMLPCDDESWTVWPLAPAAGVLAAALGYGYLRTAGELTSPGPNVALIQGSIDVEMQHAPDMRENMFRQYCELSEEAVRKYGHVDLVVWPESMFPWSLISFDRDAAKPPWVDWSTEAEFRQQLPEWEQQGPSIMARLAEQLGAPLLLGLDRLHFGATANQCYASAVYVGRDGKLLGQYDKMHLVMFGEYVPFANYFPWLQRLTPLPTSAVPGDRAVAFDLNGVRLAPSICYESVLSHVIRGQINALAAEGKEPEVLINVTNDGWYWGSSELDMHLACGVFRAVECRKPFLVAANTGFSAWIDGDGRIQQKGPRRQTDTILAEVRLDHRGSWYLQHGDWFAAICLLACVAFGIAHYLPGMPARTRLHRLSNSSKAVRT